MLFESRQMFGATVVWVAPHLGGHGHEFSEEEGVGLHLFLVSQVFVSVQHMHSTMHATSSGTILEDATELGYGAKPRDTKRMVRILSLSMLTILCIWYRLLVLVIFDTWSSLHVHSLFGVPARNRT